MQTLKGLTFFSENAVKFRNLQISNISNIDTNRFAPFPVGVMFITLRYT